MAHSDINHYIRQVETGNIYSEAVDVEDAPYTYEETEDIIETDIELINRKEGDTL